MAHRRRIVAALSLAALVTQFAPSALADVPTFTTTETPTPTGVDPYDFGQAADVTGDGIDDLVQLVITPEFSSNGARQIALFAGQSDGQLATPIVTTFPETVAGGYGWRLGDIDADGHADLVRIEATCETSQCSVYGPDPKQLVYRTGNADGTFGEPVLISGEAENQEITLGDLDGDGDLDVVTSTVIEGLLRMAWWANTGGTFGATQLLDTPWGQLVGVAAVGGDATNDVIVRTGDPGGNPPTGAYTVVLDPASAGTTTITTLTGYPNARGVGDIDGDGDDDLLVWQSYNWPWSFAWLASNGDGTFAAPATIPGLGSDEINQFALADVADDGTFDVVWYDATDYISFDVTIVDPLGIDPPTVVQHYDPYFHAGIPVVGNFDGLGNNDIAQLTYGYNGITTNRYQLVLFGLPDTTLPTITVGSPVDGITVGQNTALAAEFSCADELGGSGLASCTITQGAASSTTSPFTLSTAALGSNTATVTAVDDAGNTSTATITYQVRVLTAPGAPLDVTATATSNGSASVGFNPPADDGGLPITSYRATCTSGDGGTTRTASRATSPITVTALTPNTTYTCTVRATNSRGTGPTSAASDPFGLASLPGAPTVTSVTVSGSLRVAVAYDPPASDGGSPITSGRATCTPDAGGTARTVTSAANPIVVTGLTAGAAYSCVARAINLSGVGPASDPVAVTVPNVPGPPTVTAAELSGSRRATISFDPPTSDGGSPVTLHRTTCTSNNGGATRTASGLASPHTVTSLTPGATYTCTVAASNITGGSPASAPSGEFTVPALPSQPVVTNTAMSGALRVAVAFDPPASDGGSPVTSYRATCTSYNGGVTRAATSATSPATVTGLTAGAGYTCTVAATNISGTGLASESGPAVDVPATPSAPTLTSVVSSGVRRVNVAFDPSPWDGGSPITTYRATCTSADGGATRTATRATSPITVTTLTAGATYTCVVAALNLSGTGSASNASDPILIP